MIIKSFLAPAALAAFVAVSASASASASPTAYTTQASFLAAISGAAVDSFDDLEKGTNLVTPQNRTAGAAYSYTASNIGGPDSFFYTPYADQDVWLSSNVFTDTITFSNFSTGVSGVGGFFFGTDFLGDIATLGSLTITATDGSGTTTQTLTNPTTSSFIGFVSTGGLASLTVASNQTDFFATINNLTLGTTTVAAVPEPETYALMLGGLGLLGWMARRRKA